MTQPSNARVSRLAVVAVSLIGLSIFAGAWGYFIVTFGWMIGGTLGLWPATLMGAGSALLLALGLTYRRRAAAAVHVERKVPAEGREI